MLNHVVEIAPGTVLTVRAPGHPELELGLVINAASRDLEVAAVSEETSHATQVDYLLPTDIAGFPAAVFPLVRGRVLREQADETLGHIPDAEPTSLSAGTGFERGAPILGADDPRASIRKELTDRWAPYWEPVMTLLATHSFGELLARRRAIAQIDAGELSQTASTTLDVVAALERDDPSAFGSLEPRALAAILRKLAVIFGTEAQARLRLALSGSLNAAAPQVAYRSRRSGSQPRNWRQEDRYVAEVRRHLRQ